VLLSKRAFDISLALLLLILLSPLFLILALLIKMTTRGPVLYWSTRVGKNNRLFRMPKLRSMRIDAPQVATHLLTDPRLYLTPIGLFLRRTSLDELPQFFSILRGDQSFVGPRPALFNQDDLIALRTEWGIDQLVPGLTGWAQVNGRDELSIPVKVEFDREYLDRQSFAFDFHILWMTAFKVMRSEGVHH
jgi:O-antigen biosynthesis protein WbqP